MLSTVALGGQRFSDRIKYENQTFDVEIKNLRSALDVYLEQNNIKSPFPEHHSSIEDQRGYSAEWEVRTNSLYLVGINSRDLFATYRVGDIPSLPANAKEVLAAWFSGTMRLNDDNGQVIYLTFDKGRLVCDVEITGSLDGACETREQRSALIDFAKKVFNRPIESIHLTTRWGHPLDKSVAAVTFRRRPLGGNYYGFSRAVIFHKECPPRRLREGAVWEPRPNDVVSGPWFTDKKIERRCIVRYTLRESEVYLGPPDRRVSYNDIQQLLLSIEARDYEIAEPTSTRIDNGDGTESVSMSGFIGKEPPDIDAIGSIMIEEKDGKLIYAVWTRDRPLGGQTYLFERNDEGFILVSTGMWMS
jgi:hypothetical protein